MDSSFVKPLILWYNKNSRTLPWRGAGDPYRIWVSEIMLQQTRVEAVTGYYQRFMEALPTVCALAACPEEQLLKLWEGLGYYSRARNLQKAAKVVCEEYGGKLPKRAAELKRLPGIGDYTAGAIASIAFGEAEPAVDGNVLRVYARLTALEEDILRDAIRKKVRDELRAAYPEADGSWGILNQAFMDLGSGLCKANAKPACDKCPLAHVCLAHAEGREEEFPRRENKTKRHDEERTVFLIQEGERFAIAKRPSDGLLANLYEFPNCRGWLEKEAAEDYLAKKGYLVLEIRPLPESKHVFSHLTWRMHAYAVKIAYLPSNGQFVARKEDTLRPTDVQFSARQEDSLMPTDVQFATKQEDFSLQTDVQFAAKQKASSLLTDGLLAAGQEDDDAGNGDWIFAGPKEIQSHYPVPSAFAKYMECMAELSGA